MSKPSNGHSEPDDQDFFTSAGGTVVDVDPEILGFSKIEFTKHCLQQMRDRGISEVEVLRVLSRPQRKGLPTKGRRDRWRRHRGIKRATDVVFEKLDDRIRVITAIVVDLD